MLPKNQNRSAGFTVAELLVVIAVLIVVAAFSFLNLSNKRLHTDLDSATKELAASLREAQSRSMTQASATTWGVHIDNAGPTPFFALFSGASYSTATQISFVKLPPDVCFAIPVGSATDITFAQITGIPSASTSIELDLSTNCNPAPGPNVIATSAVTVSSQGLVSF